VSSTAKRQIRFRPRARIIRTIGDQLISGPEAAVIELVKNSYDADASFVIVRFVPPLVAGRGRIEIVDDGHGMTVSDIEEKWMEPATSSKVMVLLFSFSMSKAVDLPNEKIEEPPSPPLIRRNKYCQSIMSRKTGNSQVSIFSSQLVRFT
jgi:hypothetical protein